MRRLVHTRLTLIVATALVSGAVAASVALARSGAKPSGTGVVPLGRWELAKTFVALVLIFWWYHVDKAEHGYRAGPLLNGGMLLAVIVAMPIYFIRSRGWRAGALTTGLAIVFLCVIFGLEEAGEWLGARFGP